MNALTNSLAIFELLSARDARKVLKSKVSSVSGRTVTPFRATSKAPTFTRKATHEPSATEAEELRAISGRLHGKGLMAGSRDPLYALFVRAWTERENPAWRDATAFTADELVARNRLAAEIVAELAAEEASGE